MHFQDMLLEVVESRPRFGWIFAIFASATPALGFSIRARNVTGFDMPFKIIQRSESFMASFAIRLSAKKWPVMSTLMFSVIT
jgi:hypothetical protein